MTDYFMKQSTRKKYPFLEKGIFNVKRKWDKDLTNKKYVHPRDYRMILLNSTFTLCPSGKNVEAFRIYEAVEAGSIPVLALDSFYQKGRHCKQGFQPLIDAGAPFIFIENWHDWPELMMELLKDPEALDRRQKDIARWRIKYWTKVRAQVECVVLREHNRRADVNHRFSLNGTCDISGLY
mmetsp:Transcript_11045/g.19493  ORF Transcript_11045/g.19493 Transcript_11045/m.19493 type:complete len:180 (+) Transcript_11045:723-1262(+)